MYVNLTSGRRNVAIVCACPNPAWIPKEHKQIWTQIRQVVWPIINSLPVGELKLPEKNWEGPMDERIPLLWKEPDA